MKKALISPIEPRFDDDNNPGYRVAFVCEEEFEVAPPLFWIDCPDNVQHDLWVYVDGTLSELSSYKIIPAEKEIVQDIMTSI